jgi:hypothetical protein
MSDRAVDHLLANCTDPKPTPRGPVFERLRELLGADLARLLLFGLRSQRRRPRL